MQRALWIWTTLSTFSNAASAAEPTSSPTAATANACKIVLVGEDNKEWLREPKAEQFVTQHRITFSGRTLEYTATAGVLVIIDDSDKPIADMGYVAYVRRDVKDPSRRPIMFAFNGGPGSSSIWLHVGVLGPRRVVVADAEPTPPAPYRLVDNDFSVLDKSDLVTIDPVGTGVSEAVCKKKNEDFWGVDPDVDSISRFIAQYVSENNRWSSPKYLLGESYGTTRGAAIVDYLRQRQNLTFNGLILVSPATDIEAIVADFWPGDRPYALLLPGFAAVAWYHHALPNRPGALVPFLDEVRQYAEGPYNAALFKGDAIGDAERETVAEQLHRYTGLSAEYWKAANLRVATEAFSHELLKSHRKTVGRLDARFAGPTTDLLEKYSDYDPMLSAIGAAFTAAFLDYYHGDLRFVSAKTYRVTGYDAIGNKWRWTHKPSGSPDEQPVVNSGVDLAHALIKDPNLRVLVLNGYFDLATPFFANEYVMSHLGLPPTLRSHVQMQYYEAGHMMYLHPPSLQKMKRDLDAFIDGTNR
jgi:carboxypeptidase C (cathepsin A)